MFLSLSMELYDCITYVEKCVPHNFHKILKLLIVAKLLDILVLDMPKRPPWNYSMSKEQVERSEREMFENFLDKIYDEFKLSELSYFERNLEVMLCFWLIPFSLQYPCHQRWDSSIL